jgi:hypothetical protein
MMVYSYMSTERPIVTATLVHSPKLAFQRTITFLIGLHAAFGLYFGCDAVNNPGYLFAYIFWAFWLPSFGYIISFGDEPIGLRCYALTQCFISLFVLCSVLSILSFYVTLQDMCRDCQQEFQDRDGVCVIAYPNSTIVIEQEECLTVENLYIQSTQSIAAGIVAVTGLVTVYQAVAIEDDKNVVVLHDVRVEV